MAAIGHRSNVLVAREKNAFRIVRLSSVTFRKKEPPGGQATYVKLVHKKREHKAKAKIIERMKDYSDRDLIRLGQV